MTIGLTRPAESAAEGDQMIRPPDRFGLQRSTITTARGRYRTWRAPRRMARAAIASAGERVRYGTSRGRSDERGDEWFAQMGEPFERTIQLWLSAPDLVRTEAWTEPDALPRNVGISDEFGWHSWGMAPAGPRHALNQWTADPRPGNPRRYNPAGDPMANAFLYPGWRYLGLTATGRRPIVSALGRPSTEIELFPTLPWSDPRTLGADDLPADVEDAVPLIVIEDDETGAVVEWRCLFDGEVYERHWLEELQLGVDLDPALFDGDIEPELAPWEGPFHSTVEIALPTNPPQITIEDADDPSIRQTGLLVGRHWLADGVRIRDHAREGLPVPEGVGPFGRPVLMRLGTRAMPILGQIFLFDAERRFFPTHLTILGENVGTSDPIAARFERDADALVLVRLTLPPWLGRLHLRADVSWYDRAPWSEPSVGGSISAEYAFRLDA